MCTYQAAEVYFALFERYRPSSAFTDRFRGCSLRISPLVPAVSMMKCTRSVNLSTTTPKGDEPHGRGAS